MRAVLDAGPIIHLSWLNHLDFLDRLFEEVIVPPAVRDEVLAAPAGTLGLDRIQEALARGRIQVHEVRGSAWPEAATMHSLGRGETEAIQLTEESRAGLLVTDDADARKLALRRGIRVTGTLGILKAARESGLVSSVLPLLLVGHLPSSLALLPTALAGQRRRPMADLMANDPLELRRLGLWIGEALIHDVKREEGAIGGSSSG
ncbi:MAG: hypothetical protein HY331_11780 [Chloroflexi bacterium]|nr:hypothetical protein [Chloroflexota bacterium]